MRSEKVVMSTTHINKDGCKFPKEELEKSIEEINTRTIPLPFLNNHDFNRQIGFIIPKSARLESLKDGEFAIIVDVNIYETAEEKQKYYVKSFPDETQVNFPGMNLFALKNSDVHGFNYTFELNFPKYLGMELNYNKDGLLVINAADQIFQNGISIDKNYILRYIDLFRRRFSFPNAISLRLIEKIKELKNKYKDIEFSFNVNPNCISFVQDFKPYVELDFSWGPTKSLNFEKLKKDINKYNASEETRIYDNIIYTDFWWYERNKDILDLEIEELRDDSLILVDGNIPCKYVHMEYSRSKKKIIHLDFAIREYNKEQYSDRLLKNDISYVAKNENSSKRMKLIKIQGEIDPTDAFTLTCLFCATNPDVREYFEDRMN